MKLRYPEERDQALARVDVLTVLVILAVLAVLAAFLLPLIASSRRIPQSINCLSNLKQVNLSFRIWEGDNNNQYPMEISVTNGGAMELVVTGNVAECFRLMSNELSTPNILVCPQDAARVSATNFQNDLNNTHISYFVGIDADDKYPQRLMSGDDNFVLGGLPAISGLWQVSTNAPLAWGPGRHGDGRHFFWATPPSNFFGHIGFADGSVTIVSSIGLQQALMQSSMATNRFAIP